MDRHANGQCTSRRRPRFHREGDLAGHARANRGGRIVKDGAKRVANRLEHGAAFTGDHFVQERIVAAQRIAHRSGGLVPQTCGSSDVGKQKSGGGTDRHA